ncbi:hypothetical protein BGZ88_006661 [Linnemannia elongata]|nr:hypothetical protein BGZ88_006661 [Linnemannia elongata]
MEVIDRDINTSNIEDIPSRNATLFLRDMMLYMELSSAIKIGDIGQTFDDAKDQMEKQFQAPKNKRKHAAVSADTALDDILTIFRENNILGHDISPCVQKCKGTEAAKDLLFAGTIALQDEKRIRAFIDKHIYDSQGFGEEVENEA